MSAQPVRVRDLRAGDVFVTSSGELATFFGRNERGVLDLGLGALDFMVKEPLGYEEPVEANMHINGGLDGYVLVIWREDD